ncbi:hypothetical protein CFP65_3050 [Kitasatospora sp. MMS16-BH015]|nr:hypothetical protein CFP65_3050 [Kitasatospora sp. MMS16-BH015]
MDADMTILSGHRRRAACAALGLESVPCLRAEDVVEASAVLQEHTLATTAECIVPMTVMERLRLAIRLHALPRPADIPQKDFSYDAYTGPAVGMPSRSYWRIRSTFFKTRLGDSDPTGESQRAQQVLDLMLDAVDFDFAGRSSAKMIEDLHNILLHGGDIPISLDHIAVKVKKAAPYLPTLPRERQAGSSGATSTRRSAAEIRRAVDTISGACVGIARFTEIGPLSKTERTYLRREIRDARHVLLKLDELIKGAEIA